MKTQFLYHLRETSGCSSEDKVLLAVSGGIDSMVMLDLFLSSGISVGVAHCNFQLRGIDANDDATFVKQYCESRDIPCQVKKFSTLEIAEERGVSIQMAARDLRYEWFETLMESGQYNFLATAHNLNDNLETVLLNLTRSTGIDGMKGIPEKNGNIIRPLLRFSREQLEGYANENNISWREDSSNASDDYSRNFIRHNVVPLLRQINPNLEEGFDKTIQRIRAAGEIMEIGRGQILRDFVQYNTDGFQINKRFAGAFKNPAGVLWEIVRGYGFNFSQCEDIVRSLEGESGKHFHTDAFSIVIDREQILLSSRRAALNPVTIQQDESHAVLDSVSLTITHTQDLSIGTDALTACLDQARIVFPLTWRTWEPGDSFCPLGMNGRKKISDFLIDKKVPLPEKERVTVIVSAGEIVWVVGYRIDDRFKITPETRDALRLSVSSLFV